MYSQRNEEEILLQHLPPSGRLLDIGAFDGTTFSNSRALVERGWDAVMVEANPNSFVALARLHKGNPRVQLVHAVLDVEAAPLVKFWDSPDAVSTTEQAHYEIWKSQGQYQEIWVPTVSVAALAAAFPGAYAFINIDTEGSTGRIFEAFPLRDMGFPAICVEHNGRERERIQAAIARHNADGASYRMVLDNSENFIYVR